jgi:hypothetical protein
MRLHGGEENPEERIEEKSLPFLHIGMFSR